MIYEFEGNTPKLDPNSWVAPSAVVIGNVELKKDSSLHSLSSYVDDSGEGRWAVETSVELAVPAPVISAALQMRFRSRQDDPLGGKMLAAMRNGFGGHAVKKSDS